jgi:hypothetical protein
MAGLSQSLRTAGQQTSLTGNGQSTLISIQRCALLAHTHQLLIFNNQESHNSLEFQQYCKGNNLITLYMLPHLLHLLQPLDIGCSALLKVGDGCQAENLMCSRIDRITKLEFLPCFKAAFDAAVIENNILEGV